MLNRQRHESILIFSQAPPDFPELRAEYDRLDRGAETVIARLELPLLSIAPTQSGESPLAAQRVAEQLSAKLITQIP